MEHKSVLCPTPLLMLVTCPLFLQSCPKGTKQCPRQNAENGGLPHLLERPGCALFQHIATKVSGGWGVWKQGWLGKEGKPRRDWKGFSMDRAEVATAQQ